MLSIYYHFISKYTDIFVEKNKRSFCTAKASHIFSTKNICVYLILMFEILTKQTLTNDVISFEPPGPEIEMRLGNDDSLIIIYVKFFVFPGEVTLIFCFLAHLNGVSFQRKKLALF